MALLQNPVLFSKYFGVDPKKLDDAGLIDPFIDTDTQLFIDPVLLEKSSSPMVNDEAVSAFRSHFEKFIRLLAISENEGDAAWKAARKFLDLREPPENGLGYGGSGRSGSSRPDEIREAIMRTTREVIVLGSNDPEMVSLMGFFEEDVGPDTISDYTTRVISEQLCKITEQFCQQNGIDIYTSEVSEAHKLPKVKNRSEKEVPLILVPKDIVRELVRLHIK